MPGQLQHPNGPLGSPSKLTALHLLSLLAVFSGFMLGFISGFDFFFSGGGIGALVLTVGGALLFVGGLALKIRLDRAPAAEEGKGSEQGPPKKVGKISLFVMGLAAFLHPRVANAIEGVDVPRVAGVGAAVFLVAIFMVFWFGLRMPLGEAAENMYKVGLGAGLLTVVLYLGVIGVFLPRQAWEKDRGLRRLLWSLGIRSLLGLRVAGYFFLFAVAFVMMKIAVPSLLGRLR